MHGRKKAQPQLESLESMTLLSGAAAAALQQHSHAEVATPTPTPGSALTLSGTERGVFLENRSSTAKNYSIDAAGTVSPVGHSAAFGNLHVLLGISSGPPNGTLHLLSRKGNLTLQIPQSVMLPAGLPTPTSANEIVDTYTITRGTGAFSGDTGSGVVEFTFNGVNSPMGRFQVGTAKVTFTSLVTPMPVAT